MPNPLNHARAKALKQPGLYIPGNQIFADAGEDARKRIYSAVIGQMPFTVDGSMDIPTARENVRQALDNLFQAVLQYAELYHSVKGKSIVWDAIANDGRLYCLLDSQDVKTAVEVFANARRQYLGNLQLSTPLTELIDEFNTLADKVEAERTHVGGTARTFTLTMGQGPPVTNPGANVHNASNNPQNTSTETADIVRGLTSMLVRLDFTTEKPWPPSHFTPKELTFLADPNVVSALGLVDRANREPRQAIEDADSFSAPVTLRIHLCRLALIHYTPDRDWSLWMGPVGFLSSELKSQWYLAAGRPTRAFTTIKDFFTYATDAFMYRGKSFVVGMFTHWVQQSYGVNPTANITREDPDVWTRSCDRSHMMQRYATVVIIRFARLAVRNKVQIITYDPIHRSSVIHQQYAHSMTHIFSYRNERLEAMKTWVGHMGATIHSQYFGGHVPKTLEGDSVQACMGYLESNLAQPGLGAALPGLDDQQAFERQGFTLTG